VFGWTPRPTTEPWQIQLQGKPDLSVAAPVYEFDGDATPASVVQAVHRRGARALCYLDAGSWESYRSDAARYPLAVRGRVYAGFRDERWLDIRQVGVILPLVRERLRTCARKGFDGADPDNMAGYENPTGFPLTGADQLRFNRAVAGAARSLGLAVVLKNDGNQVRALRGAFDGAVVESCFQFHECSLEQPFVTAGKPVYDIEYSVAPSRFCPEARRRGFSAIFKRVSLFAYRRGC
jgi:hypothetical protein